MMAVLETVPLFPKGEGGTGTGQSAIVCGLYIHVRVPNKQGGGTVSIAVCHCHVQRGGIWFMRPPLHATIHATQIISGEERLCQIPRLLFRFVGHDAHGNASRFQLIQQRNDPLIRAGFHLAIFVIDHHEASTGLFQHFRRSVNTQCTLHQFFYAVAHKTVIIRASIHRRTVSLAKAKFGKHLLAGRCQIIHGIDQRTVQVK